MIDQRIADQLLDHLLTLIVTGGDEGNPELTAYVDDFLRKMDYHPGKVRKAAKRYNLRTAAALRRYKSGRISEMRKRERAE